jgi:hypothetical protein
MCQVNLLLSFPCVVVQLFQEWTVCEVLSCLEWNQLLHWQIVFRSHSHWIRPWGHIREIIRKTTVQGCYQRGDRMRFGKTWSLISFRWLSLNFCLHVYHGDSLLLSLSTTSLAKWQRLACYRYALRVASDIKSLNLLFIIEAWPIESTWDPHGVSNITKEFFSILESILWCRLVYFSKYWWSLPLVAVSLCSFRKVPACYRVEQMLTVLS